MEQFIKKIESDPALNEKYSAVLKKHEDSRDRNAVALELSALAQAEGYDISSDKVLARGPKGELGEMELENVSGGGSGLALCQFEYNWDRGMGEQYDIRKKDDGYETTCLDSRGTGLCNWLTCRCWGTSHCTDGYHTCNKDGSPIRFHGITT